MRTRLRISGRMSAMGSPAAASHLVAGTMSPPVVLPTHRPGWKYWLSNWRSMRMRCFRVTHSVVVWSRSSGASALARSSSAIISEYLNTWQL